MSPGNGFTAFARMFELKNALLVGTPLHYNDTALCTELTARLSEHLEDVAFSDNIANIADYGKWKKAMMKNDKAWATERATKVKELVQLAAAMTKVSVTSEAPAKTYSSAPTTFSSVTTTRPLNDETHTPIPTLPDDECTLLKEHRGCFKCRKFYAGHQHKDCPDWPSRPYKALTTANSMSAQKCFEANKKAKIAAVSASTEPAPNTTDDEFDSDDDLVVNPVSIVAAVFSTSDGALSTNMEDTWDSEHVPLSQLPSVFPSPHLIWHTHVTSSISDSPIIESMIDSGATVNLISESAVNEHSLCHRKLLHPMPFTDAFTGDGTPAMEYCRISLSSENGIYSSCTVHAIIVPTLCYPLILGVPFLDQNHLLIDMHNRELWDSSNGVNILNPQVPRATAPPPLLATRQTNNTEYDHVQARLRLAQHHNLLRDIRLNVPWTDTVPPLSDTAPQLVAAVHQKVEELVQYDCPKKYREAFKTLLTQHIDAGQLRPSFSPYASPCFLVPKADPTALPRWVNDYHVLNQNTVPDVNPLPSIQEILSDCT
ncbi:hypothetical protein K466DRAFT_605369 [Polyporus arcularius HHB13444]|uniref:Peptidase A2 domain-containing protein n=1 Tax=Polyporus arcularius HHB13444 TaxID=1314778 RepID=A0A5C3NT34_9APHY|nr:hypothetical protein K466DRAFT_605369 [Polyporus arcularius HHB13444]